MKAHRIRMRYDIVSSRNGHNYSCSKSIWTIWGTIPSRIEKSHQMPLDVGDDDHMRRLAGMSYHASRTGGWGGIHSPKCCKSSPPLRRIGMSYKILLEMLSSYHLIWWLRNGMCAGWASWYKRCHRVCCHCSSGEKRLVIHFLPLTNPRWVWRMINCLLDWGLF